VVYTPDALTADDVIEQWIGKSPEPTACVVATGDNAESRTARSLGATVCPPEDLKVWCEQASARQGASVRSLNRANDREWRQ
jgi:predicted RNA-binding protein with PIN domain